MATQGMKPYIVKLASLEPTVVLAHDWHEAWLIAINTYGLTLVKSVRPGVRNSALA